MVTVAKLIAVLFVGAFFFVPCASYYRDPLPPRPIFPGPQYYGPAGTFMYYIQGKPKSGYSPQPRPPPPPPVCPPEEPPPYEKYGPPFIPYCDFSKDNFCDYVDYYPAKLIEYLLRRRKIDVKSLLNEDAKPSPPPYFPTPPKYPSPYPPTYPQYGSYNSSGYPPSDKEGYGGQRGRFKRQLPTGRDELCDSDTRERVPMAARAEDGQSYYVVNNLDLGSGVQSIVNTRGRQTVTQRECAPSQLFEACRLQPYCTPTGATRSVCDQQMGQLKLLVLEQNGDQLALRPFRFFSGCVCTFTRS